MPQSSSFENLNPRICVPNSNNDDQPSSKDDYPFFIGQWLDVKDSVNKWLEAQVINVNAIRRDRIYVHYKGWKSKFDEWLSRDSWTTRVAPLHTHTPRPPRLGQVDLAVGVDVDVLDTADKWIEGRIIHIQPGRQLRVHYHGWGDQYDEWLPLDSYRIAPLHLKSKPHHVPHRPLLPPPPPPSQSVSHHHHHHHHHHIIEAKSGEGEDGDADFIDGSDEDGVDVSDDDESYHHGASSLLPLSESMSHQSHRRRQGSSSTPSKFLSDDSPRPRRRRAAASSASSSSLGRIQKISGGSFAHRGSSVATPPSAGQVVLPPVPQELIGTPAEREYRFRQLLFAVHRARVVDMANDGNCLFRAVAHQVYGDAERHELIRAKCMDYMWNEREFFRHWVADCTFEEYIERMRLDGQWGDHIELQAMSEIYQRPIEIFAYQRDPFKVINPHFRQSPPIRLSYHFQSHYNSIVFPSTQHDLLKSAPGAIEDQCIRFSSAQTMQNIQLLSDIEATDSEAFRAALQASRAQAVMTVTSANGRGNSSSSSSHNSSSSSTSFSSADGFGVSIQSEMDRALHESLLEYERQQLLATESEVTQAAASASLSELQQSEQRQLQAALTASVNSAPSSTSSSILASSPLAVQVPAAVSDAPEDIERVLLQSAASESAAAMEAAELRRAMQLSLGASNDEDASAVAAAAMISLSAPVVSGAGAPVEDVVLQNVLAQSLLTSASSSNMPQFAVIPKSPDEVESKIMEQILRASKDEVFCHLPAPVKQLHDTFGIPVAQAQEAYAITLSELGLDGAPDDVILQTMLANLYRCQ